jgi:hypothetical protein
MTISSRRLSAATVCIALWGALTAAVTADTITVPNASFESPPTTFATPLVDSWQQTPTPDLGNPNTLLTGVFSNVPPPIENCDGGQAVFLFAYPYVGLAQDYDTTDWANPTPTHAFDATFEVGKAYSLTVGVIGGGGGMAEGATLDVSLYYRNALGYAVPVAATNVPYTAAAFPDNVHFVDFQTYLPTVKASDPWAGKHIGVQLVSIVSLSYTNGGYWDVDNVRLSSFAGPMLLAPAFTNAQFSFTVQSDPGLHLEILASTNIALPLSSWTSLGTLTNATGRTPFVDPTTDLKRRYYRAREVQ